jgi:hypothetical protein
MSQQGGFHDEGAATAMAAFGLAQIAVVSLVSQGLLKKEAVLNSLEVLIEGNRGGGSINQLAANKLEMFAQFLKKSAEPPQP